MNMCTVKEIREAIREDCRSQRNMETIEIDRIFQTLTFPQLESLFDKPPILDDYKIFRSFFRRWSSLA